MSKEELQEHQLFISSLRLWITLKLQNKLSKKRKKMRVKITLFILLSAPFRWMQSIYIAFNIKNISLKENQPVFVIGHWRSGTTHLHYLLSQDQQFSYLEAFQAFFFRVAFVSKTFMRPILNYFMPSTRPQDNIKINASAPTEEEHPLTNLTEKSGMQTFFFPKNRTYYDKYNIFKGTSEKEKKQWKKIYHKMLLQIALFQGKEKKLLLKNPHNTARIKILLELYPNAKFIFIHRNPYDVFKSNIHLYNKTIKSQFLQEFSDNEIKERVLYCYETTLRKYIKERELIPTKNLIEISYQELSDNPQGTIQKIYQNINLGNYETIEPKIKSYLLSVKNYKKNTFSELSENDIQSINSRWLFSFNEWNYPVRGVN